MGWGRVSEGACLHAPSEPGGMGALLCETAPKARAKDKGRKGGKGTGKGRKGARMVLGLRFNDGVVDQGWRKS